MKKFTLLFVFVGFIVATSSQAQVSVDKLKGSGEVFFYESFGWENADDPKGYTLPEGYYHEDPSDNGYQWHWWPNDSLIAEWTKEPPFQSTSKEDGHLCLFANLYNNYLDPRIGLDNSIVFPTFDFSDRTSVVLRFETNFMNYSSGVQLVEVSNDAGVHWAAFDCGFGCGHKERPNDVAPGEPAIFQANISEVAAGMSEVVMKITWRETSMYYWLIDDLVLAEAWDNDLQMQHFIVEWDDGDPDTEESTTAMMPKSQLGGSFFNFQTSVLNFGEFTQNDTYAEVEITKNNQSVFNAASSPSWLDPLWIDTANLEGSYMPEEYGHYKIAFDWKQSEDEQTEEDNYQEVLFHVTDSVYSRADESMELSFSPGFEWYTYGFGEEFWNIEHFAGSQFPIYGDCEVEGVSVFITGGRANGLIDFMYSLYWEPPAEEDPDNEGAIRLLTTEILELDSTMFGKWLYMPFEKDGESEFLLAGDMVYAGIDYNCYFDDELDRRNYNIAIGSDQSSPRKDARAMGFHNGSWGSGGYIGKRNLMIKLILNDHGNVIDNVPLATAINSMDQNYPNPFEGNTQIDYELNSAEDVMIEITDITGKVIKEVYEGNKSAGKHSYFLNAEILESGIYFYTLKAGDFVETKRMIVK